jgi:hypothetical protein
VSSLLRFVTACGESCVHALHVAELRDSDMLILKQCSWLACVAMCGNVQLRCDCFQC